MTEIAKQTEFQEALAPDRAHVVRSFVDSIYREAKLQLPCVRNRHEGYGFIVERMNGLAKSHKGVKSAVNDCESMLSARDASFVDMVSNLYDEALGLVRETVELAVHAQNIVCEIITNQPSTPLEDMANDIDIENMAFAEMAEREADRLEDEADHSAEEANHSTEEADHSEEENEYGQQ